MLFIANVNVSNRGGYICTAKNEYGIVNMTFNLNVLSKLLPHILIFSARFINGVSSRLFHYFS